MIVFVDDFARKNDRPSAVDILNQPYALSQPSSFPLIGNVAQFVHSVCELIDKSYEFFTENGGKIDTFWQ